MQPMPFVLDEQAHIVLFDNEAALDAAMADEEELEGILLEPQLDVGMLVEDQIPSSGGHRAAQRPGRQWP